jgi:peptide/nickel transport system ATP-binding protein
VAAQHVLETRDLTKTFLLNGAPVPALDGVSLALPDGTRLAVVGESGCGKSTLARVIMNLTAPDGGEVIFRGERLSGLTGPRLRESRQRVQMIFQDPSQALNSRMIVRDLVSEPLMNFRRIASRDRDRAAAELLAEVGLDASFLRRHPHSMSGGQLQRVAIARALALRPELIVCDEATSALDVSIQKTILDLLDSLAARHGIHYLLICHDIALAASFASLVVVMYRGRIMETLGGSGLKAHARHPYTRLLLDSVFETDGTVPPIRRGNGPNGPADGRLAGEPAPARGCGFAGRCECPAEACARERPPLREAGPGHFLACHREWAGYPPAAPAPPGAGAAA